MRGQRTHPRRTLIRERERPAALGLRGAAWHVPPERQRLAQPRYPPAERPGGDTCRPSEVCHAARGDRGERGSSAQTIARSRAVRVQSSRVVRRHIHRHAQAVGKSPTWGLTPAAPCLVLDTDRHRTDPAPCASPTLRSRRRTRLGRFDGRGPRELSDRQAGPMMWIGPQPPRGPLTPGQRESAPGSHHRGRSWCSLTGQQVPPNTSWAGQVRPGEPSCSGDG
jgi:hypothetical protein